MPTGDKHSSHRTTVDRLQHQLTQACVFDREVLDEVGVFHRLVRQRSVGSFLLVDSAVCVGEELPNDLGEIGQAGRLTSGFVDGAGSLLGEGDTDEGLGVVRDVQRPSRPDGVGGKSRGVAVCNRRFTPTTLGDMISGARWDQPLLSRTRE